MTKERVLPAAVFDTLELSALAFGGIGRGSFGYGDKPCCIFGHARYVEIGRAEAVKPRGGTDECGEALMKAGIYAITSDSALLAYGSARRISFAKWCKRLNVVRSES